MGSSDGGQSSLYQEFLTPEAMLTPGVAGSLTMMITNALAVNFHAPRPWIGLLLSFVFGLLVLVSSKTLLQKSVFYILNSLVIFCVAVGANGLGENHPPSLSFLEVGPAFAQSAATNGAEVSKDDLKYCANLSSAVDSAQKDGASNEKILKLIEPCQSLSRDILTGVGPNNDAVKINPSGVASPSKFFGSWRF
jgi:hypothetical protein